MSVKNLLLSTALVGAAYFAPSAHVNAQGSGGVQFDTTGVTHSLKINTQQGGSNNQPGILGDYRATMAGFVSVSKQLNDHVSYGALIGPNYDLNTHQFGCEGNLFANWKLNGSNAPINVKAGLRVQANFKDGNFTSETAPAMWFSPNSKKHQFLNNAFLIVDLPLNNDLTLSNPTVSAGYALPLNGGKFKDKGIRVGGQLHVK